MSRIGILILAAGASTRLGQPKQLLRYQGKPLIRHMAEVAIAAQPHTRIGVGKQPVGVVLGAYADVITPHLSQLDIHLFHNPHWQTGMASSIQWGLCHLLRYHSDWEAIILMVCDQPFISPLAIQNLISGYQRSQSRLVASEYSGTLGVPALFHQCFFPDLLALRGDRGAKAIIQQHRSRVFAIPFPAGAVDMDTPQDVAEVAKFVTAPQERVVPV